MNNSPLVSAVLIFYNAEKFIQEAIESVFAQVYNNWELLLVDDGSTDASTQIARRHAEQCPDKVCYFEHAGHQNRGMSASRNLGIRHSRGEFIGFLDADDVWLPHKLEKQLAILNAHPEAAMVYGQIQWWYSWTGNSDDIQRDFVPPLNVPTDRLIQPPKMLVALLQRPSASTTSSLVRREMVERVGGFEESFRGMYEDQAFAAKVYAQAAVFVVGGYSYRWRKHADSSSAVSVNTGQYGAARFNFLCWLKTYLSERNIQNRELQQALDEEFWEFRHPWLFKLSGYPKHGMLWMKESVKRFARSTLPAKVQHWLRVRWHGPDYCPPVGCVDFGSLRRLQPVSRVFGFDRGLPIDRYYIEYFLSKHAADIRGHVLELGDNAYTRKFGGDRVTKSDVLHAVEGNPEATMVADLTRAEQLRSEIFDCIICTQTLMFIYDVRAAVQTLERLLKPSGILLVTLAGVSHQISRNEMNRWGDYWRFTSLSARRLFEEVFPASSVTVNAYGNVLAAIAFLHGLTVQELRPAELDASDPDYEVVITIEARKPARGIHENTGPGKTAACAYTSAAPLRSGRADPALPSRH
jgi:glycosyltransferase involved in cell wall biosynthesis/SAM-dependent methyltransferase